MQGSNMDGVDNLITSYRDIDRPDLRMLDPTIIATHYCSF